MRSDTGNILKVCFYFK